MVDIISDNFTTPGTYARLTVAAGQVAPKGVNRDALIVAPMVSGDFTPNTMYKVKSASQVISGAGAGSPLHTSVRGFLNANKSTNLYVIPYEVSGTAADGYFAIGDSESATASKRGVITVEIQGVPIQSSFNSGDACTSVVSDLVARINAKQDLEVTAAAGSTDNQVVLTAKYASGSSNNYVHLACESSGGLSVTKSGQYLTGGASFDTSALTTALDTVANLRKYYIGIVANDQADVTVLKTHLSTKSEPLVGLRSVGVVCLPHDSLSTSKAISIATNFERLQLAWQGAGQDSPAYIMGQLLGCRAYEENIFSATNLTMYQKSNWTVKPCKNPSDIISKNDVDEAIRSGLTVINSNGFNSYIESSRTSRCRTNNLEDLRAAHTNKVSASDDYLDQLMSVLGTQYRTGWNITNDQLDANGVLDLNLPRNTVCPAMVRVPVVNLLRKFNDEGKIQNVQNSIDSLVVQRGDNQNRIEIETELHVVDPYEQTTIDAYEVSQ